MRYSDGRITRVSTVAVTIPPTIGAAMRRITSDPVPEPHMIGNRPTITVITVISRRRDRVVLNLGKKTFGSADVGGMQAYPRIVGFEHLRPANAPWPAHPSQR
mgnify:CR=1 FL=1